MARSTEEVPGMATAVERRRREVGLTPGRFAEAAGVTPEGLIAVRKGYRRSYQDRLLLGVADALQWPPDWYERLLAGEDPATFAEVAAPRPRGTEAMDFNARIARIPPEAQAYIESIIRAEEAKLEP